MDNQDFRLQQYSEAFRLFGAESIGRAWGAKGRNSPFFYMCNGTVMRFPMCSFCESFYPNSLYSEFSKRTCKGIKKQKQKQIPITASSFFFPEYCFFSLLFFFFCCVFYSNKSYNLTLYLNLYFKVLLTHFFCLL